jgi:hypothetical protein
MSKPSENAVEGRALVARPSLRLLLVFMVLVGAALSAPAAQAAQPDPVVLTKTNPSSSESQPSSSTIPFVQGRGDGSIITSLPPGEVGGYAFAADINPTNVVALYTSSDCSGSPYATGTIAQLEGAGIQVEVAADSTTTFYATQTDLSDPSNPSECSKKGLTYWHSSTAVPPKDPPSNPEGGGGSQPPAGTPPPAPHLRTIPGGRANDNTPKLTGSAPGANTVKVFGGADCKGAPVAQGSQAQFAAGLEVRVVDNMVATFSAASFAGGNQSACSDPVTYVEDSTAPRTRITMGPGAKTRRRTAVFRFTDITDNAPGTAFFCKLDRRKWKPCGSPYKVKKLPRKPHTVRVKAVDSAGNAEGKGAKRRFKVIP